MTSSLQRFAARLAGGLRSAGRSRVSVLTALLIAATTALWLYGLASMPAVAAPRLPWPLLVAAFAAAEVFVVHVQFRQDAHSLSLSELPLVLGLYLAAPRALVVAQLVGCALTLIVHRRQNPTKLAFNLASFCFSTSVGAVVFHALLPAADPGGPGGWLAALVAVCVATLLTDLAIFGAISLSTGQVDMRMLPPMVTPSLVAAVANTALALAGISALLIRPQAALLLLAPIAVLVWAYRAYNGARDQHQALMFLYEASRLLHAEPQLEPALVRLLQQARERFRADSAELTLLPTAEGQPLLRTAAASDSTQVMVSVPIDGPETDFAQLVADGQLVLARAGGDNAPDLRAYLQWRGFKDAVVAPLRNGDRVIGALVLAERMGDVSTFDASDAKLLEALAHTVGVAFENGNLERSLVALTELKEQLAHQAFHDALTGLANRTLFTERVEHALRRSDRGQTGHAVLFIDLDDFKPVNDGLGHAAGDRLLVEVSARLSGCLRPADTAARLGGDEFAILAEDTDVEGAAALAERICTALRTPFHIMGRDVRIGASIGIALADMPGLSGSDLLRNADVAMYRAKNTSKGGHSLYEDDMHGALVERLHNKSELRRAVELGQLVVEYQPLVDLPTGEIAGVEALIRWEHPERGQLLPAQFVGLAEETGLIVPIGRLVLAEACRQVGQWRRQLRRDLFVTVNLSVAQLDDPGLVEEVAAALEANGLRPRDLVLEITESMLMNDHGSHLATLRELKALGVQLAIDDFGTGYSSLAYLRTLPVDLLKVAKDFVAMLETDADDAALARVIVELGATLGLRTVAEGVEHRHQHDWLRAAGCDFGQGYLYAQPLGAPELEALLLAGSRCIGLSSAA